MRDPIDAILQALRREPWNKEIDWRGADSSTETRLGNPHQARPCYRAPDEDRPAR